MTEQWQELKETITELRDNDGTGTQQEVCKFLVNYMDVLEKQMQNPCEDEYIKVPKRALRYRTAGMVAYNTEWLKNHFDIERAVICGAQEPCEDEWTIKQYQVPIENKQIPTIPGTALSREPTACKIVCTYTHSACKSEEYLNKYKFCPNCGKKMKSEEE